MKRGQLKRKTWMKRSGKPMRRRAPAKTAEAVKVFPDGREVCQNNSEGDLEYNRRTMEMAARQRSLCALCGGFLHGDITFDHEVPRGLGGAWRDDRIEVDGRWRNAAVHYDCNMAKGSRRVPYLPEVQRG